MNGSFNTIDSTLNLRVANLEEFKELLQKAQEQADELQKTISQLEFFNLKFKFSAEEAVTDVHTFD